MFYYIKYFNLYMSIKWNTFANIKHFRKNLRKILFNFGKFVTYLFSETKHQYFDIFFNIIENIDFNNFSASIQKNESNKNLIEFLS